MSNRGAGTRRGSLVGRLWRCRWNVARLCVAGFLLWFLAADTDARLARLRLSALPDFDFVGEARHLREAGRYGEAMVVADAGLASTSGTTQHAVLEERQRIERERGSALRRLRDVGLGALTGSAGLSGEASLERLGGAIAADMFAVGDVRDLLIEGSRYVVEGEADPVVVALSGLGLATTVAPEVDWAPALLKIARKAGALRRGMQEAIVAAARSKRGGVLASLMADVRVMAREASPAGAIRLMRYAEEPADAARLARFLERNSKGSSGAFALHVGGEQGAAYLKQAEALGPASVRAADAALVTASTKGRAGIGLLRSGPGRALLRAHPVVGLAKGLWKGNVQRLASAALERMGPAAWWLVPLLAAWVLVEAMLLWRKVGGVRAGRVTDDARREGRGPVGLLCAVEDGERTRLRSGLG